MRSYKDIGLISNPFHIKSVYDYNDFIKYPFLITESQELLKNFLESIMSQPWDDAPGYYVILGERGIGKTSTLLWLDSIIKSKNDDKFVSKYERSIRGLGSIQSLVSKLLPGSRTIYTEHPREKLESYLKGKRYFWFIDVPDRVTAKEIDMLTEGLEIILGFRNISVFIAMNKSHYHKTFDFSEIMGKFTPVTLKSFSLEETEKLIQSRIDVHKINEKADYIFTPEAIEKIHEISKGIPRNIISVCEHLLGKFLQTDKKFIDSEFVNEITGKEIAEKILEDRIDNDAKRKKLYSLYVLLKEKSIIEKQEHFINEVSEELGWCRATIIKYLRELEKLGLVRIEKSMKDSWTNVIRVVV